MGILGEFRGGERLPCLLWRGDPRKLERRGPVPSAPVGGHPPSSALWLGWGWGREGKEGELRAVNLASSYQFQYWVVVLAGWSLG